MHIEHYLVTYSDLVSVGGIGFDLLPALSFFACLLVGVWHHLCPSKVMPWYQVFQKPFAGVMLRYRVDIFPPPTRVILVIAMPLSRTVPSISPFWQPLLIFVIRKGKCQ